MQAQADEIDQIPINVMVDYWGAINAVWMGQLTLLFLRIIILANRIEERNP